MTAIGANVIVQKRGSTCVVMIQMALYHPLCHKMHAKIMPNKILHVANSGWFEYNSSPPPQNVGVECPNSPVVQAHGQRANSWEQSSL
jgi:hypothetical protein